MKRFFRWFSDGIRDAFLRGVQEGMEQLDGMAADMPHDGEALLADLRVTLALPAEQAPRRGKK
jgi:hypothetical protein